MVIQECEVNGVRYRYSLCNSADGPLVDVQRLTAPRRDVMVIRTPSGMRALIAGMKGGFTLEPGTPAHDCYESFVSEPNGGNAVALFSELMSFKLHQANASGMI